MKIDNDSPNGVIKDALCMLMGGISGTLVNYGVYQEKISKSFDFMNGVMIFSILICIGILAIQKLNNRPFNAFSYALTMTLVGWGIGAFIIVEIYGK